MAENLLTNYRFIDDWREIIMNDVKEAFQDKYPNDITVLSLGTNIYGACESLDVHLELGEFCFLLKILKDHFENVFIIL